MGTLLKTGLFFSLIMLNSCHYLMPSCINGFDIYKMPIEQNPKFALRVNNGYYSSGNKSYSGGRYFFLNGKTKSGIYDNNNDLFLSGFSIKEHWAEYMIIDDTILIQKFNYHTSELCKRWVFETKGLITSDTTYLILSTYDYRFKRTEIHDPPILMTFVPDTIRPDSTVAWYLNKSWYKNQVHNSRK